MKQGIKTTIIALLLVAAAAVPGYAQKVYKEGGAIVLDFGPDSGFPQRAVETVKGRKIPAETPSNSTSMTDNDLNGVINATVYRKLEVAAADESSTMQWVAAYAACQNRGSGWRLPTQRELMAILLIFRPAIVALAGSSGDFVLNTYWSATEYQTQPGYAIARLANNVMDLEDKTALCYVRCVREL